MKRKWLPALLLAALLVSCRGESGLSGSYISLGAGGVRLELLENGGLVMEQGEETQEGRWEQEGNTVLFNVPFNNYRRRIVAYDIYGDYLIAQDYIFSGGGVPGEGLFDAEFIYAPEFSLGGSRAVYRFTSGGEFTLQVESIDAGGTATAVSAANGSYRREGDILYILPEGGTESAALLYGGGLALGVYLREGAA